MYLPNFYHNHLKMKGGDIFAVIINIINHVTGYYHSDDVQFNSRKR